MRILFDDIGFDFVELNLAREILYKCGMKNLTRMDDRLFIHTQDQDKNFINLLQILNSSDGTVLSRISQNINTLSNSKLWDELVYGERFLYTLVYRFAPFRAAITTRFPDTKKRFAQWQKVLVEDVSEVSSMDGYISFGWK